MFHQPSLEARLGDRARDLSTLVLRRGVEAVGLTQSDEGVIIHARNHDGAALEVRCRYAVGCDGANSTIRQLLDIPTIDLGFFYDWLIVDVVLHEQRVYDPINVQVCDPARPTTVVSGGPGRRRWEFMRRPDETLDDLNSTDAAWRLLAAWDVTPDNATLERHAVYTFKACHAAQWQNGRVLLAGDAAHLMPPFAGQGMCSGIRDVANLAWKLDLALGGRGGDSVLDSYTEERLPHARAVIDFSTFAFDEASNPSPGNGFKLVITAKAASTSSAGILYRLRIAFTSRWTSASQSFFKMIRASFSSSEVPSRSCKYRHSRRSVAPTPAGSHDCRMTIPSAASSSAF